MFFPGRDLLRKAESSAFTAPKNFIEVIQGKAQPVAPVRYGALLSALMDAMYESAAKGAPVKVKPVPEKLD